MAVLAASVPVLVFLGFREVANSRSGRLVDVTLGPDEPGYEAIVARTPVLLLAHIDRGDDEDAERRLLSLTVLALSTGTGGGAVLFLPVATEVDSGGSPTALAAVYERDGLAGLRDAAAHLVGTSFDEAIEVDAEFLAQVFAPVAPLEIANPDDVITEDGDRTFPAGPIELSDDVGPYLAAKGEQESDLARLVRHEAVWSAWLSAVAASTDPGVVPGETNSGLGRFVRALAAGSQRFESLPVEPSSDTNGGEGFRADTTAVNDLLSELVPFPASPTPGARLRLRVLNGLAADDTRRDAALRALVHAGAEIETIGNAQRLDHEETSITYYDPNHQAAADLFRAALGVGTVVLENVGAEIADVTVILGRDYLEEETTA